MNDLFHGGLGLFDFMTIVQGESVSGGVGARERMCIGKSFVLPPSNCLIEENKQINFIIKISAV